MQRISDFLELEDEEFDIDEATEFLKDVKIELSASIEAARLLTKLESRIKKYMLAYGEVPNVEGVEAKITPKKDQLVIRRGLIHSLYAHLKGYGVPQEILDEYFEMRKNNPAISLRVK